MLKINKKVEYALMGLKYMSEFTPGQLISAREICDNFNIPFDTVAKVMQQLNNHDILKSVKGIKGGYILSKTLDEISYMDLVRLVEGKSETGSKCISEKGTCELYKTCNIITPVEKLNKKLNLYLETLTLNELLSGTEFEFATNSEQQL